MVRASTKSDHVTSRLDKEKAAIKRPFPSFEKCDLELTGSGDVRSVTPKPAGNLGVAEAR